MSTPSQQPQTSAFLLTYAAVVKRAAAVAEQSAPPADAAPHRTLEEEMDAPTEPLYPSDEEQQVTGLRLVPTSPEERGFDDGDIVESGARTPLFTPKVRDAKPYIPTYLAAVKSHVPPVMLGGFPVNVHKGARHAHHLEGCSSTTFSNSLLHDNETEVSWVDDDESFQRGMARAMERGSITHVPAASREDLATFDAPRQQQQQQQNRQRQERYGNGAGRGRGGRQRGNGSPTATAGARRPGRFQTDNGTGTAARPPSGGRFDVLIDKKVMRHL